MLFFFLTCVIGPLIGRRLGWGLSRGVLYWVPIPVAGMICGIWGILVAWLLRVAIIWLHPNVVLKVLAFGFAAYVSIPNYGLFAEGTLPGQKAVHHLLISYLPLVIFVLTSVGLAFLKNPWLS